jgi:hypothetical protein
LQIVELVIIGVGDRRPIALRRIGLRWRIILGQRLAARRSEADQ